MLYQNVWSKGTNPEARIAFFEADNRNIQYTGRIDFSNPKKPRFWASGVYIKAKFKGTSCEIVLNDQVLWGTSHNYLSIVIDSQEPFRVQTTGPTNRIKVAEGLPNGEHTILICKDTEAGIGYLEFVGIYCEELLRLPARLDRRIEFYGNSITCGTGSDLSTIPCGQGQWYDQHNAYQSYGPTVARELNAEWQLTSVSGIGLIHSCCDLAITMPQVYNKIDQRGDSIAWKFKLYIPHAITICLGQNDGIQDSTKFCSAYVNFIASLRKHNTQANIFCLTSPMADEKLRKVMKNYLTAITDYVNKRGDKKVHAFFFSKNWNNGCDAHPHLNEHKEIAKELSDYIRSVLRW